MWLRLLVGGGGLNGLECLGSKCSQVQVQVQAAEAKCSPTIPHTSHHLGGPQWEHPILARRSHPHPIHTQWNPLLGWAFHSEIWAEKFHEGCVYMGWGGRLQEVSAEMMQKG